ADLNPTGEVFLTPEAKLPPTTCSVAYSISALTPTLFRANLVITDTAGAGADGWALRFELANGQVIQYADGAIARQSRAANGRDVTLRGIRPQRRMASSPVQVSFIATDDGTANAVPPMFHLNQRRCASL